MSGAINDPFRPPYAIRPRLRALLGGVEIPGALSATISSTNDYHADRFQMRFAPTHEAAGVGSWAWWSAETGAQADRGMLLDIQIGAASDQPSGGIAWQSILLGQVDNMDMDRTGYAIDVEGRDLTARLIDTKIEAAYQNNTSSEIVEKLGAGVGLKVRATRTTTPVGRFYNAEHAVITQNQFSRPRPQWDLITLLARYENFDVFVERDTLFFQPRTPPNADPYVIWHAVDQIGRQAGNVLALQLQRSLTIAKGLVVVVRSWHSGQKRAFTRTSPGNRPISPAQRPYVQQYVEIHPNLTEDQAQRLADQIYRERSQQIRTISGTLPGDTILTPRAILRLTSTGTEFDRIYYPYQVTRNVDADQGYTMQFSARSLPPSAETSA